MKGIFFLFSIVAFLVVARGELLFGSDIAQIMTLIVIPGYLITCGVMLAYVFMQVWQTTHDNTTLSPKKLSKIFIGGLLLGSLMAVAYVLV